MKFPIYAAMSMVCAVSTIAAAQTRQGSPHRDRPLTDREAQRASGCASCGTATLAASGRANAQTASGPTTSPFTPPAGSDTRFIVNGGPFLDTGCLYRSGGPIRVDIPVTRAVTSAAGTSSQSDLNPDGTLRRPEDFIANGLLSPIAILRFPAFDIDSEVAGNPEIDEVYFNGVRLTQPDNRLRGIDGRWVMQQFEVPIELVRFALPGASQSELRPSINRVEIRIDVGNVATGREDWCMNVDWMSLEFGAFEPVIFVHGFSGSDESWDAITMDLRRAGTALQQRAVDLGVLGVDNVRDNARELADQVRIAASDFGADAVHIVAHSKGGLDARWYIHNERRSGDPQIRSLTTLGTPHGGSVLADVLLTQIESGSRARSSDDGIAALLEDCGLNLAERALGRAIGVDGLRDLTVGAATHRNRTLNWSSTGIPLYCFAADPDVNGDRHISSAEAAVLAEEVFETFCGSSAAVAGVNLAYELLGSTPTVTIVEARGPDGEPIREVVSTSGTAFQRNDGLVTIGSAQLPGAILVNNTLRGNHQTFLNPSTRFVGVSPSAGDSGIWLNNLLNRFPVSTPQ